MGDKTHTNEKAPETEPKAESHGGGSTAEQTPGLIQTLQAVGNLAMQRLSAIGSAPFTFGRVKIHLDPARPWLFTVEGNPTPMAITTELYGADFSMLLKKTKPFFAPEEEYEIVQQLLLPDYQRQFHDGMRKVLEKDIDFVEDKVLETWVDSEDEDTLMSYVAWWAARKDLRTETGRTYFDAFLARLKQDSWYRDYGLWKGSSEPFLDKLYKEVGNHAGELNTLIAQNSVEFGAYRPLWLALEAAGGQTAQGAVTLTAPLGVNRELVERSANMILAGLDGITWKGDSRVIRDTVVGLPPPEQAAVLKEIMSRYDERKWGIFGKYGEAWEGGMLYWLFEDLTSSDRQRVADALKANKVLPAESVDALVAGRGWGGKWLPWTTHKAEEATQFWADYAVKHEGEAGGKAAAVAGSFSSLWLPHTAGTTVLTLTMARAATPKTGALPLLAEAFPRLGTAVTLAGTGITSFNVTVSVQEVVLQKDVWTGKSLSDEEVLSRALMAISGTMLLGTSFAAAAGPGAETPPSSGGTEFGPPRLVYSGPGPSATAATGQGVGGGGGGRVVIIARGNTLTKVVINEAPPMPAAAPALKSVPLEAVPVAPPVPAFPGAPAPVASAAAVGGVTTSTVASPAPAPAPVPSPNAPTGRTQRDAIPIIWFKHPSYYPEDIELGGREYSRDVPTELPLGEPIGVPLILWPRIGKTMLMIPEDRGPAADDFRRVLRDRYGFDWEGLQADHVQDVMWEGPDAFQNLWPMDASANQSAGPRQNQFQIVTFRDDNGLLRSMTIQEGRDAGVLEGRWFVITEVRL